MTQSQRWLFSVKCPRFLHLSLVESKKLSITWNDKERELFPERYAEYLKYVEKPSSRILVQSIIVNALVDYYFITGKSCSSKKEA